jgi:hypothetical protein
MMPPSARLANGYPPPYILTIRELAAMVVSMSRRAGLPPGQYVASLEFAEFEFTAPGGIPALVTRRIAACLEAVEAGAVAALETDNPVG